MLQGQREGSWFHLIWWLTSNQDNPYFYNDTYREHRDGKGTSAFGNFSTRAVGGAGGHLFSPPHILAELEAESVNKSQKKFFLATILLKSKQKTSALASKMGQIKKWRQHNVLTLGIQD